VGYRRFVNFCRVLVVATGFVAGALPAYGQLISNPVAVFNGLDKITGRITVFDVYIDEIVQFGSLQLTPKVCYSRPTSQAQSVTAFVQVDEVSLQATVERVFSGWMFADSPALNAVDNAVYDVWLVDCRQTSDVPPPDQR
jgi:hypothetical protein